MTTNKLSPPLCVRNTRQATTTKLGWMSFVTFALIAFKSWSFGRLDVLKMSLLGWLLSVWPSSRRCHPNTDHALSKLMAMLNIMKAFKPFSRWLLYKEFNQDESSFSNEQVPEPRFIDDKKKVFHLPGRMTRVKTKWFNFLTKRSVLSVKISIVSHQISGCQVCNWILFEKICSLVFMYFVWE